MNEPRSALQFIREAANGGTLELGGGGILYLIDTRVFLQLPGT